MRLPEYVRALSKPDFTIQNKTTILLLFIINSKYYSTTTEFMWEKIWAKNPQI